jgi:hypothetical protein
VADQKNAKAGKRLSCNEKDAARMVLRDDKTPAEMRINVLNDHRDGPGQT